MGDLNSTTHAASVSLPPFYQQHHKNVLGGREGGISFKGKLLSLFG